MAATSRGRQVASVLLQAAQPRVACAQCAHVRGGSSLLFLQTRLAQRSYSSAATTADSTEAEADPSLPPTSTSAEPPVTESHPGFVLRAGLLLSRPPLLTREMSPFEASFYLYQKRLNERLSTSFRKNVYFKPNTSPALDWRLQLRDRRGTPARDIGLYEGGKGGHGRGGAHAWDDEITTDDPLAAELTDPVRLRERILSDADLRISEDGQRLSDADRVHVERPQPRITAADGDPVTGEGGDVHRLDRRLDRTLYLIVRNSNGIWHFPTDKVRPNENLHQTASRVLKESAGGDMNTWIVGRVPVAHLVRGLIPKRKSQGGTGGEKIFFLKGRIMAGQANLKGNAFGLTDFKWLTKEELANELPRNYFASVQNSMPER